MKGRWGSIRPEAWRGDLLAIILRVTAILGFVIYVPSVVFATMFGMWSVVVMDTVAIAAIIALTHFARIPTNVRACCTCLVFYLLGAGLMFGVGSISQTYLLGFSLMTTLIVHLRWGLASVVLNLVTMLVIGYVGIAAPEMVGPLWRTSFIDWTLIAANFAFVNVALVLVVGAIIQALEQEQRSLVAVNQSLALEVRERIRTEESLEHNKVLLGIAGRTAHLGGWRVVLGNTHVEWSDETCDLHEVPPGTSPTVAEAIAFYAPESRELVGSVVERCATEGTSFDIEAEIITARGTRRWVRAIGKRAIAVPDAPPQIHGSVQDITLQKLADARTDKLEEQLRQAQKMEAIGSLAGGIAHDFNNLLSVVLTYSEMFIEDLDPSNPMRADVLEVQKAGRRAAALTAQLLAFSRKQILQPQILDLGEVVTNVSKMLGRLLGEDIELSAIASADAGTIRADNGQIEQVIMNLAVNARDAMPRGGRLTIETRNVWLDDAYAAGHAGVTIGMYVMLAVSDTGMGMDRATQDRVFEPFFTTKDKSKGTGLGLSTVYGIVQRSGGHIRVYSELGVGTTFKIYFPHVERIGESPALAQLAGTTLRGSETILVVEDEEQVRTILQTVLGRNGYQVLVAQNAADALLLCERFPDALDMMLTDVVMPRMSGQELGERVGVVRPRMKVLYMSGFTEDAIVHHGILHANIDFLSKPIMPDELLRKVRQVLDAGDRRTSVLAST